jgi:hypothetical protein
VYACVGGGGAMDPRRMVEQGARVDLDRYLLDKKGAWNAAQLAEYAIGIDKTDMAVFLLGHIRTEGGMTCSEGGDKTLLHLSAELGRVAVVRHLVETRGLSVRKADVHGNTPLHYAAEKGRVATVEYLLGRWGRSDTKNEDGMPASTLAIMGGHAALANRIQQNNQAGDE